MRGARSAQTRRPAQRALFRTEGGWAGSWPALGETQPMQRARSVPQLLLDRDGGVRAAAGGAKASVRRRKGGTAAEEQRQDEAACARCHSMRAHQVFDMRHHERSST